MAPIRKLMLVALIPLVLAFVPGAARAEKRIALLVGNAGYQAAALTTPANDAGLIAQTLQAAGFDVVGARDLDQDSLRRAFRDFLEKATAAGPDTVAFIYLSGYGVQLEGENYFVPVDAKIAHDTDVAAEALRISDYVRPLAALKLKTSIVVLDAARANPFAKSGPPLAGGLALVEPEPGLLIAFNAAPGTVAPEGQGPYGAYAQALAEMMREGGLPLADIFDRARLRVNDVTKGAEVPWHTSKVEAPLVFFERAADAPPPAVSIEQATAMRARPLRDLAAQDAYAAALERDTLDGYTEFLGAYPDDPMAARVRAIIAARREAITWRRTRLVDTPPAYWSYLRRYPQGPHAADAHRRLAFLAAAFEPPPTFTAMAYDVPPPPPEEIVYIRRPVLVFDDPVFAFAPPPPPPVVFLAPPPPEFVVLAPPPPPIGIFVLPIPVYRPVPVWVRPPAYVAPPPNNVIYNNVHNTVVINNTTNTVTITNPAGQTQTLAPAAAMAPAAAPPAGPSPQTAAAPAVPAPAASLAPALPPSVAHKAATLQAQPAQGGAAPPSAPGSARHTTGLSARPTTARDERAAFAIRNRHASKAFRRHRAKRVTFAITSTRGKSHDTDRAFSRDLSGRPVRRACRRCQACNSACADAGCNHALGGNHADDASCSRSDQAHKAVTANADRKTFGADHAFSRNHAGRATAWSQARDSGAPSARRKAGDTAIAAATGHAGHGFAVAATGSGCQARSTATTNACCKSGDAARECKAHGPGGRRHKPGATSSAQSGSAAAERVPAWEDHDDRQRSARLQIDQAA
jgi:uncharacterized caspase-like protein